MKIKMECIVCDGKCEIVFNEKEYVEPDKCPFCGNMLAEWEREYITE